MYDSGRNRKPRIQDTVSADLDAFRRYQDEVPIKALLPLLAAIDTLPASEDPAVMFAALTRISVPLFSDGCDVDVHGEDGAEQVAGSCPVGERVAVRGVLLTPFSVESRAGLAAYAGVVTHWWNDRVPDDQAVIIADLLVRQVVSLVDRERLMSAIGWSEDRAARSTLRAIAGRSINIAVGMVMKEFDVSDGEAEVILRQLGGRTGRNLAETAAAVMRGEPVSRPGRTSDRGAYLHIVSS